MHGGGSMTKVRPWITPAWFLLWIVIYKFMGIPKVPLEVLLVLLLYFAIATPVRAVPGWLLLILFAVVNVVLTWATVFIQMILSSMTGGNDDVLGGIIAPVTEEVMKFLPVAILYAWPRPRVRDAFGATDWMLCGAACGAGAQLWEDVLIRWQNSFPPRAPSILGFPLIAGYTDNGRAIFIGHVATTAFIALALGWSRYIKPLAWKYVPAALVMIWMIVDHAGNNLRNARQWYWMFANGVYFLGARGRIAVYAFLVAVVGTIGFEAVVLSRTKADARASNPIRRLIRSHQARYAKLAGGSLAASDPGWSLGGFLRRTLTRGAIQPSIRRA